MDYYEFMFLINKFVKEMTKNDLLIFDSLLKTKECIVINKQLNSTLKKLSIINQHAFKIIYKKASELNINNIGLILLIIKSKTDLDSYKKKSSNVVFSMTQNKLINKSIINSLSTQKSLVRLISEAEYELILFGYDITYPDNPAFQLLKEKVGEGNLKMILIAHKTFLSPFKYHWGWSSFKNITAYTIKFPRDTHNMHAKIAIADKKTALITSANLTFQGMKMNLEIGVIIESEKINELYEDVQNIIKNKKSELVNWDNVIAELRKR